MRHHLGWASLMLVVGAGCADEVAGDPCALAATHFEECFGVETTSATACDPAAAQRVADTDCDGLAAVTGKADNPFADFFCSTVGWDCPSAPLANDISSVRFPGDGTFWLRVSYAPSTDGAHLAFEVNDVYQGDLEGSVVTSDPVPAPFDGQYVLRLVEQSSTGEPIPAGVCLEAEAAIVFDLLSELVHRECTR